MKGMLAILAGIIVIDQVTKATARVLLASQSWYAGPVGLVLATNSGVAFGLFGGSWWVTPLNVVLGIVVAGAFVSALRHKESCLARGLLLVLGGFVGNLLDRICYGKVTDFLWIRGWSVFNVADCSVVAGSIIVGLALFLPGRSKSHG